MHLPAYNRIVESFAALFSGLWPEIRATRFCEVAADSEQNGSCGWVTRKKRFLPLKHINYPVCFCNT
jgi:hypothetical protein